MTYHISDCFSSHLYIKPKGKVSGEKSIPLCDDPLPYLWATVRGIRKERKFKEGGRD